MSETDFLRATRVAYDAVADDYAAASRDVLAGKPLDRALLAGFADLVRAAGARPVADVGCGPGEVTAHLAGLGLDVVGIDLSAAMLGAARRAAPQLPLVQASMTALGLADGVLGGVAAMYSIIHTPPDRLPAVLGEFFRVLAPGGQLLLVFQAGDTERRHTEWFGHPITLSLYRRPAEQLLAVCGFQPRARLLREPDDDGVEKGPRAYLLARRPLAPRTPSQRPGAG
jgi:SAM-dependent methyltransferase